ncbi:pyrimidine 5'-nucleotidase [Limimaricola cinnabarinus]|jgi:putative hydrolase of the HAD superfamily|uniref:Pyrimidine 5'-nucleotidase n=1 Tax=Limimaricola cinnabarinus TaxID=1125964 RepID=A0A2G1MJ30_9RHOB|nr:pyrimidine 5'-nucleotidase [Limimaricola cinnabarinus]PHP28756.1 pyrimidine 5'-nucleotidase [Limimaricola cinnabarinus]
MTALLTDIAAEFAHVRAWVFDLDNTLYPPEARLFSQIEVKMRDWMVARLGVDAAEADRLRADYWARHGTTLAGLMAEHGLPADEFLVNVHDIDLSHLDADPALARAIAALPGRRIVYTNGSEPYARRVLAARGLTGAFDAVYGVEHAGLVPKPQRAAFEAVFALDGLAPEQGAMFEDDPRNLAVPHAMGMRTVLVGPPQDSLADHIHHHTDDLSGFVSQLA